MTGLVSAAKDRAYFGRVYLVNALLAVPSHPLRRYVLRRIARWQVSPSATVMRGCRVLTLGGVSIGSRTIVGDGCLLDGRGGLTIGEDSNISGGTRIFTAGHDPDSPTFAGTQAAVRVGDRAWVASGSLVLPGTTVGDGVVVAAGAVVHGTLEPWSVYAGNPARRLRARSGEAQARLDVYRPPFL